MTDESLTEAGSQASTQTPSKQAAVLSGQQHALHEALNEKDSRLGAMYLGCVVVLGQEANPERLHQGAHSIRELIEKIPSIVQVPTPAHKERMGDKVHVLDVEWSRVEQSASATGAGDSIDHALAKFLVVLQEFFAWLRGHRPRRRAEARDTLRTLDASGRTLPEQLEELNVEAWVRIRDFFIDTAHHRRPCTIEEFRHYLDAFERFLLDSLRPRTFADFEIIDALIQEGEANA